MYPCVCVQVQLELSFWCLDQYSALNSITLRMSKLHPRFCSSMNFCSITRDLVLATAAATGTSFIPNNANSSPHKLPRASWLGEPRRSICFSARAFASFSSSSAIFATRDSTCFRSFNSHVHSCWPKPVSGRVFDMFIATTCNTECGPILFATCEILWANALWTLHALSSFSYSFKACSHCACVPEQ